MMLTTSEDQNQSPNSFSVDTDGVYFIIDNSATVAFATSNPCLLEILNIKQLLSSLMTVKKVGTICLVLKDDAGKNWSCDIPDIVYDLELPYSLLGISFLAKYFAKNDKANEFDK